MWWPAAALVLGLLSAGVGAGCSKREAEPLSQAQLAPVRVATSPSAVTKIAPAPLLQPTQLLTLTSSAYQASIFADDEAVELLTSTASYHLVPGKETLKQVLDLGFGASVTKQRYVYWSNGGIWSAPRTPHAADTPKLLQRLAQRPQRFVSDITAEEIAWLSRSEQDRYSIQTLQKHGVQTLYTSPGSIDALTLIGDAVYFVERPEREGWRIGRVGLLGAAASFTAGNTGRWPAMLSGVGNVVYYDGSSREVRALSLDLTAQRSLAKDFVCSPLVANIQVYCATLGGMCELPMTGAPQQLVALGHVATSLAATATRLVWIADTGSPGHERLLVNELQLGRTRSP